MKKILIYVLLLAMLVSVFASCGSDDASETSGVISGETSEASTDIAADLEAAKAFLKEKYRTFNEVTRTNYTRINSVKGGNTTFSIEWSVEGAGDAIELEKGEETTIKIKVETNATEINYTLKATLKAEDGTSGEVVFNYTIPVIEKSPVVAEPKAETAYKFGLSQMNKGKNLYFTGEMDGYFLATTEDYSAAIDVYLEEKDGGFALYFNKDSKKNYINIVERDDEPGSKTIKIEETANCIYKFDSATKILIATVKFADETTADFYLGTYSSFETISSSSTSYITGEKAADIGVSQFPAYLINGEFPALKSDDDTSEEPSSEEPSSEEPSSEESSSEEPSSEDASKEPSSEDTSNDEPSSEDNSSEDKPQETPKKGYTVVKAPKADTAYKFALTQANEGKDLYLTGEMNAYYLATSENKADAIDVYLEAKAGGFALYFNKDSKKNYINIVERDDAPGKVTIKIEETSNCIYTFDSTLNILITNVADKNYWLGTYKNFVTMSASSTFYIEGDKAAEIGVSQFPAYLVTIA